MSKNKHDINRLWTSKQGFPKGRLLTEPNNAPQDHQPIDDAIMTLAIPQLVTLSFVVITYSPGYGVSTVEKYATFGHSTVKWFLITKLLKTVIFL